VPEKKVSPRVDLPQLGIILLVKRGLRSEEIPTHSKTQGWLTMSEEFYELKSRKQHVWVKDRAGNEYICPVDVLRDPKNVSEEELKNCIDDASIPQPHAGG